MLLTLEAHLLLALLLRTGVVIVPLLDTSGQLLSGLLNDGACEAALLVLLLQKLLVKCVLLLSDRIDSLKVVHVLDWRRASTSEVTFGLSAWGELVLMH